GARAPGGAVMVGHDGERGTAPVQAREDCARAWLEDAATPDAPVEVEDEAARARQARVGHGRQASVDRAKSAIASWYTSRVRLATLAQLKCASTRCRPARPRARPRSGSSSSARIATASASGRPGW